MAEKTPARRGRKPQKKTTAEAGAQPKTYELRMTPEREQELEKLKLAAMEAGRDEPADMRVMVDPTRPRMSGPHRITNAKRNVIVRMYNSGATQQEIAHSVGVSIGSVGKIIKERTPAKSEEY